MRTCNTCKREKLLTEDHWPIRQGRNGEILFRYLCKPCTNEALRAKAKERMRKAREKDEGKAAREAVQRWKNANLEEAVGQRRGRIGNRCSAPQYPSWGNKSAIACIYRASRVLRNAGHDLVVDHLIPLKSEMVCGLHVWNNLQIIGRKENRQKGNYFDPEAHEEPTSWHGFFQMVEPGV